MEKIKKVSPYIFAAVFTYIVISSFITQDIYASTVKYASLVFFICLCIMSLPYLKDSFINKDPDLFAAAAAAAVAMINLVLLHSHKGAVLIPTDMALSYYVARRISLPEKTIRYLAFAGSALLISWYGIVKWDYNFNMFGLTLLIMTVTAVIFLEDIKWEYGLDYLKYIQALLWTVSFLYTTLYHSRCSMGGMLVFGILMLFGRKIAGRKIIYTVMVWAVTLGSVIFTLFYMLLSSFGGNTKILYKNIFSGRQDIWTEIWNAFLKQPFTGIGSSYKLKSFDIFEVHNGLFDILAVHGIIVFILILFLLVRIMMDVREEAYKCGGVKLTAMAGLVAMLFTSFFENFFTVPPYSLYFFLLLATALQDTDIRKNGDLI